MVENLYDIDKVVDIGEDVKSILKYKNIVIKRIVSSENLEVCTFSQEEAEWVLLVEGSAEISMKNRNYILKRGDFIFIPKKQEHTILKVETGTIWLAIHIYDKE